MNYVFGVEFVEVDPITTGTEKFAEMDLPGRRELLNITRVDPRRYRGRHGTAILSSYKLENVRLIPLKYRFAAHFGRTLTAINDAVDERISDHYPITVDLPFAEPVISDTDGNSKK